MKLPERKGNILVTVVRKSENASFLLVVVPFLTGIDQKHMLELLDIYIRMSSYLGYAHTSSTSDISVVIPTFLETNEEDLSVLHIFLFLFVGNHYNDEKSLMFHP